MRKLLARYLDVLYMIEEAGSEYYALEQHRVESHENINQALYGQCHNDVYDSLVEEVAEYLHNLTSMNINTVVWDVEYIIDSFKTKHRKRF